MSDPNWRNLLEAAAELLPFVGEIVGGEFIPCPLSMLSTEERSRIQLELEGPWRVLLAAVTALDGPQECGTDPFPNTREGLEALANALGCRVDEL